MKFHLLIIAIALFLCAPDATAQTGPVPETDFQIWNDTTVTIPVIQQKDKKGKEFDRLAIFFTGTLRLGQNRATLVDERIGAGLDLALNHAFTFSPNYLYRAEQPGPGRKAFEHRIRFDLTYEHKWKTFSIKNRGRIEYRIRNSHDDSVRYRNKFTFKVPVKRDGKEILAPFVADEPYYDFTAKEWSRNDLTVGIAKTFGKVGTEFFYVWRHNRRGLPQDINAVGVNLKFKLKNPFK
jgi:hypothetical protein